ncbi:uncharacterized protein [Anoplolepis gracilipes]|uniref:uncharacterized protein n=1 Tax=Anoplolepis gracilipes TaxID=354296 RepID=UPI003BA31564
MITTLGKIPNEMYYLEDTTSSGKTTAYGNELHTTLDNSLTILAPIGAVKSDEYTERSTLVFILLTVLLIILFMCCITACIIARSRSRHAFFTKSDMECDPECSGVNQPLLGLDRVNKTSDITRTSDNSTKN